MFNITLPADPTVHDMVAVPKACGVGSSEWEDGKRIWSISRISRGVPRRPRQQTSPDYRRLFHLGQALVGVSAP